MNELLALMVSENWAEAHSRAVISLQSEPENHALLDIAGTSAYNLGQTEVAKTYWSKAATLHPQHVDTHQKLVLAYTQLREYEKAADAYQMILQVKPEAFPDSAWLTYADLLMDLGRIPLATLAYENAVKRQQADLASLVNKANALHSIQKYKEAHSLYQLAIRIYQNDADQRESLAIVYGNMASNYEAQRDYENAAEAFAKAAEINPLHGSAWSFAGYWYRQVADWKNADKVDAHIKSILETKSSIGITPFPLTASPSITAELQKTAAELYSPREYQMYLNAPALVDRAAWRPRQKIRVGYLSSDFREHAVSHVLAGVLEAHDQDKLEVTLYAYGPESDLPMRKRLRAIGHRFENIDALSQEEAARKIATDEIDILVDLMGHTAGARLGVCALRPAPIIMTWIGYPGTLGHPRLADYNLSDAVVTPLANAYHYVEHLALMPHSYQCNDDKQSISATPPRSELDLPENAIVYCSFNQAFKISEEMFLLWCRILQAVPGSVLWLKDVGAKVQARFEAAAASQGIAKERIIMAPVVPLADHLGRMAQADICLDTQPYTGHATASNALWAGVPMITMLGNTFSGRVGASLLNAIQLPELITDSTESYFALAKELGTHHDKRLAIRQKLAQNRLTTPLFDTQLFARDLERMYETMWQNQRLGIRDHIVLPAN